jgi:peptidoglycan/LPS O-acetylase OafA/YrhL
MLFPLQSRANDMPDSAISRGASPNLDLLRSVAVLLVLLDHVTRHYYADRILNIGIGNFGLFGVLLFFVHTSLVLMHSMHRSGLTGMALAKDFYLRRFFRIYPLSIVTVLSAVALHLHASAHGLGVGPRPGVAELVSNLFLVQNLTGSASVVGPLWSLPIEVQMYGLLPLLFLWRKRSSWWLLLLWGVCGILGHFPQTVPALSWFTLLIFVPNFLPGIIAFGLPEKRTIPAWLWLPFILLLAVLFVLMPTRRIGAEACLLLGLALPRFKEITLRPLQLIANRIATYSYGIYLGHSFFIYFALTRLDSWLLFWLMWIVIPVALYHCLERPAIQLGIRLARKVAQPRLDYQLTPETALAADQHG